MNVLICLATENRPVCKPTFLHLVIVSLQVVGVGYQPGLYLSPGSEEYHTQIRGDN